MGILDPQTQGLLQAAFAGMSASGPSRTPVSLGQVLGQAGSAGLKAYDTAEKQDQAMTVQKLQVKKLEQEAAKAQVEADFQRQIMAGGEGGILGAANDPDRLEAIGTKLAMMGHPGGAGIINAAENMRKKRDDAAQFKTLKSSMALAQPDPQENQQAADQGTPEVPAAPVQPGGLFKTLANSPYVGQEAGLLQSQLNAAPNGSPELWLKHYERLQAAHNSAQARDTASAERFATLPKSTVIIQDRNSPTGWSHKDTRTDEVIRGAPPPSSTNAIPLGEVVPAQNKDLHGPAYLATLPSGMAELIKSIAEGRVDPAKAASMRYGNREAFMQRVLQYDPTYNGQRPKVWQDFTSGKSAQNITAMNTVVAHIGTLDTLTDALKNGNVQAVNQAVNAIRNQLGKPEINNAEIAVQAVGNELMRVFRQVNASQTEVKEWEEKFKAAKGSPDQIKGALKVGVELLKGRLDAVNDQWKRGMGTEEDFPNILSPKSKEVLGRLGGGTSAGPKVGDKSTSKSGKPIRYDGQRWVYE